MAQSRARSLFESVTGTASGFCLSWFLTWALVPLFTGQAISAHSSALMTSVFTLSSIVRGYGWRRWFNSARGNAVLARWFGL